MSFLTKTYKRWKREKEETWRKFLRKQNHRRHKEKFVRGRYFPKGQPLRTIPSLGNYSLTTWKFWETNFKWLKPPRNHRNHPKEDAQSGDILRKLNMDSVLVATWRQNLGGSSSWPVAITKDLNSRARDGERRRGLTGFNSHPRTSFIRRLKTTGMSASFHRDFPFFLWRVPTDTLIFHINISCRFIRKFNFQRIVWRMDRVLAKILCIEAYVRCYQVTETFWRELKTFGRGFKEFLLIVHENWTIVSTT